MGVNGTHPIGLSIAHACGEAVRRLDHVRRMATPTFLAYYFPVFHTSI
jgi:hypothetical protein